MIIAIDIGNSNVVVGAHDGSIWRHTWRLPTLVDETLLFYEMRLADYLLEAEISPDMVDQVVLSSVVPPLTGIFTELANILFHRQPLIVACASTGPTKSAPTWWPTPPPLTTAFNAIVLSWISARR